MNVPCVNHVLACFVFTGRKTSVLSFLLTCIHLYIQLESINHLAAVNQTAAAAQGQEGKTERIYIQSPQLPVEAATDTSYLLYQCSQQRGPV